MRLKITRTYSMVRDLACYVSMAFEAQVNFSFFPPVYFFNFFPFFFKKNFFFLQGQIYYTVDARE